MSAPESDVCAPGGIFAPPDRCSACGGPYSAPSGHRHSAKTRLCAQCAWFFWRWTKERMRAMQDARRRKRRRYACPVSFAEAATVSCSAVPGTRWWE